MPERKDGSCSVAKKIWQQKEKKRSQKHLGPSTTDTPKSTWKYLWLLSTPTNCFWKCLAGQWFLSPLIIRHGLSQR
ncbi:hypothetical protein Q9966_002629 [Columba livia]|nr:hypothetical protein Q9966_002629 [Columba livia]